MALFNIDDAKNLIETEKAYFLIRITKDASYFHYTEKGSWIYAILPSSINATSRFNLTLYNDADVDIVFHIVELNGLYYNDYGVITPGSYNIISTVTGNERLVIITSDFITGSES